MNSFFIVLVIGGLLGTIDVIPMKAKKMDTYSVSSAFVFHLILPFLLWQIRLSFPFYLTGGFLYLICSIPIIILVSKEDKKSVPIILITSTILGISCSFVLHFFNLL